MNVAKIVVGFMLGVFLFFFPNTVRCHPLSVYDGNVQNIVSAVSEIVSLWKIGPTKVQKQITGYRLYFGSSQKYEHLGQRNSVYIHFKKNEGYIDYITVTSTNLATCNSITGRIIGLIAPDAKKIDYFSNIPSQPVEYPMGTFYSSSLKRKFMLYNSTKDSKVTTKYKITVSVNNSGSNNSNRLPYEWEKENCVTCGGTGKCDNCGGSGQEQRWDGARMHIVHCHRCGGTGVCRFCSGSGKQ